MPTPALTSRLPAVGTTIFTTMSALAQQHGAVNLGQGFPDFDGDPRLMQAVKDALDAGHNQYPPMAGVPALREAIAAKIAALHGRAYGPGQEITITAGATQAILTAVLALVHPGDEVIVLDPCYDSYEPAIELAGARAVHVPLVAPADLEQGFHVDWQRVRDAITPHTRMLLINSPHNPTGAVLSRADLDTLAELLRNTDIVLLSDEVYEHIVFDGAEHQSVLRHPELAARSFVVSSFGKTYHCTGWKLGYCIAPAALSAEFRKVHQYLTFCSFSPAQWAFAEMIERHPEHYLELPAFYQEKRDRFRSLLADTRFALPRVDGAYFQLADYSSISDLDDVAFSRWLTVEKGVAAIPLSPFYQSPPPGQRLIRFCFAKSDATQVAAVERLRRV